MEVPLKFSVVYKNLDMDKLIGIVYREMLVDCSTLRTVPGGGGFVAS